MKRYMILCVAAAGVAAGAQDLRKEIAIEREIVPEVRAVAKPAVYPRALTFTGAPVTLDYTNLHGITDIEPEVPTLEAARPLAAFPRATQRGYLDLGYFPAADASLSAGYAIIDNQATGLNIWAQADHRQYKGAPRALPDSKTTLRNLNATLGAAFYHRFGDAGTLSAATSGGYRQHSTGAAAMPLASSFTYLPGFERQTAVCDIDALWRGTAGTKTTYYAGARYGIYNYLNHSHPIAAVASLPAVHQSDFGLRLGTAYRTSEAVTIGIDADLTSLHYNSMGNIPSQANLPVAAPHTLGLYTFTPYLRAGNEVVDLRAGARVDFSSGAGKVFHIAPDVSAAVYPASTFAAWLKLGGGEHRNTLQSLDEYACTAAPWQAYTFSHVPIEGSAGLRVGPFKGAALTVDIAYMSANDWLVPSDANQWGVTYAPANLRAWKGGATLTWAYRSYVELRVRFETLFGSDKNDPWPWWRDGARQVLSASATFRPVDRLILDLGYEMRLNRYFGLRTTVKQPGLGDVNNLCFGAAWRFTEALSAFVRLDNMLDQRAFYTPLYPTPGFTALAGITLKF